MKKNKKLPILIGAAILIYFLLPKKSTSGGGGTSDSTNAPSNQMRLKQNNKVLTTLNQSTRKPADVNGIIN
jgi:hypothetical protein